MGIVFDTRGKMCFSRDVPGIVFDTQEEVGSKKKQAVPEGTACILGIIICPLYNQTTQGALLYRVLLDAVLLKNLHNRLLNRLCPTVITIRIWMHTIS